MKKGITLFFGLTFSILCFSQSIEKVNVEFKSERLPLEPLEGLDGYSFTVETPYKANNDELISDAKAKHESDLANYPNVVTESEENYERALVEHEDDVIKARENYKLKADEYDKLSAVEKIALKAKAPVLRLPSKPRYYKPSEPVYQEPNTSSIITFDPEVLAASYLKLAGYKKAESGNVLTGLVVLNDFQSDSPIRRSKVKKVYNSSTKTYVNKTTHWFITKYNRPTFVKLQLGNEILFEGILESSLIQDSIRTERNPDIKMIERKAVKASLDAANDFINSKYGYSQVNRKFKVEYVKNKKGEYDDLESAKDLALGSYKDFAGGKNTEKLTKAVELWTAAYTMSDVDDRKTRINKKVTISILLNLINSCLVTEKPSEAANYLSALKGIKVPYAVSLTLDDLESEIIDLKARVEAKI